MITKQNTTLFESSSLFRVCFWYFTFTNTCLHMLLWYLLLSNICQLSDINRNMYSLC